MYDDEHAEADAQSEVERREDLIKMKKCSDCNKKIKDLKEFKLKDGCITKWLCEPCFELNKEVLKTFKCKFCSGKGWTFFKTENCSKCGGTGRVYYEK